jgi:hypothetical protein
MKIDWKSKKIWTGAIAVLWLIIGQFGRCSLIEPWFFLHAPWRGACQKEVHDFCLSHCSQAGTHREWKSAKELDIEENLRFYQERAMHGDLSAQMDLANYYRRDDSQAEKWFRMAAEQGSADAQVALGRLYELRLYTGRRNPEYKEEAVKWLRKSAEQGDRTAIRELSGTLMLMVDNEERYFWTYVSQCISGSDQTSPPDVSVSSEEISEKCPSPSSWGLGPLRPTTKLEPLPVQQVEAIERRAKEWILAHKFKPHGPPIVTWPVTF